MADPNQFDWSSLIGPAIGAGTTVLGQTMANRSNQAMTKEQLAQQQKQFDTTQAFKQSEQARRNMMQGAAAPTTLRALGYRNPQQIDTLQKQFSQQQGPTAPLGGGAQAPQQYTAPPAQGSSGISKGIGAAGLLGGAAIGGLPGLAVGGAAMLGSAVANQFGQGRRAADAFVQSVENPFWKDLAAISEEGKTSPQTAAQKFTQAYQSYKAAVNQSMAGDDNQKKVAQQSMANLAPTLKTMAGQLGVQI